MGTVHKAMELLNLFTRQQPRIGLSDIARISGTNKATCHRLLSEMERAGLVEQVKMTREYRLGPAVLRLAMLREAEVPLRDALRPVLQRLSQITGESAHSSALIAERLQMMDFVYAHRHGTRVILDDTDILPFHATSSGLAVLAFAPSALRDRVLATPLEKVAPHTETDPDVLNDLLHKTRLTGYAEVCGGFEADVHGIAVPLFGQDGACFGALAVAAPAGRMTPELKALILQELFSARSEATRHWGGCLPLDATPHKTPHDERARS